MTKIPSNKINDTSTKFSRISSSWATSLGKLLMEVTTLRFCMSARTVKLIKQGHAFVCA